MEQEVEETRCYIGLMRHDLHMMMTIGPAKPEMFDRGPSELITIAGTVLYPVSPEIAAEWSRDDDD